MGWNSRIKNNITAAISNQSPVVRDLPGRVLEVGDEVILSAPLHTYRVSKVEPVRAPGAPANLMHLQLVSVIDLPAPRDQPMEGVIRVRTAAEIKAKGEETPEQEGVGKQAGEQAGVQAGVPEKATTVTLE